MRAKHTARRTAAGLFILIAAGGSTADQLAVDLNFTGSTLYRDSPHVPPDTMGAVGPDHVVELINGRYSAYRKTDGVRIQTSTLNDFWLDAGVGVRNVAFDPRIVYDPYSKRWFAVSVENARADNAFLVAVSRSSDPTQGWNAIAVDADPENLRWADYPTLGINAEGIYVHATMPSIDPSHTLGSSPHRLLVVPKQDLLVPGPLRPVVTLVGSWRGGEAWAGEALGHPWQDTAPDTVGPQVPTRVRAPRTTDSTPTDVRVTLFLYGVYAGSVQPIVDLDNGGLPAALLGLLYSGINDRFYRADVSGGILSPSLIGPNRYETIPFARRSGTDRAVQPPPKPPVEILNRDALHSNIVRRNGRFWGVHTVRNASGRTAIHWFQIDAEANEVLQEGLIASDELGFFYGSIAVNEFGDVVIGFNGSSETQYISSYAVLGQTIDGVTTFAAPVLLRAGQAGYEVIRRDDRNRWGDYSATVVDPVDPRVFWTFQEYVSAEDVWSTGITRLVVRVDGDGDGIPDDEDACPDSDLAQVVVVGGCDSGVANTLSEDGCTISDRVARCARDARHHGRLVSCAARVTNELRWAGIITGRDAGAIRNCTARAGIP